MKKYAQALALLVTPFLIATLVASNAFAFPLTSKNWTQKAVLSVFYVDGFSYDGIIALSNCSGSLVRFKSSQDTDKALLLTNGHCFSTSVFGGMLNPGEVVVNYPQKNTVQLLTKNGSSLANIATTRVLYATMTATDITLFELANTYAEIGKSAGVRALTLADTVPAMGQPIQIPSGYWKRTYACSTDVLIPELREAGYVFKQSIRFSQPGCETIGGTSGSPIVSSQTGEVIGINNTGNEDGEECTMNNPCEVDNQGQVSVHKTRSYGQQTYLLYGCLSSGPDRINLNQPSCLLPRP